MLRRCFNRARSCLEPGWIKFKRLTPFRQPREQGFEKVTEMRMCRGQWRIWSFKGSKSSRDGFGIQLGFVEASKFERSSRIVAKMFPIWKRSPDGLGKGRPGGCDRALKGWKQWSSLVQMRGACYICTSKNILLLLCICISRKHLHFVRFVFENSAHVES